MHAFLTSTLTHAAPPLHYLRFASTNLHETADPHFARKSGRRLSTPATNDKSKCTFAHSLLLLLLLPTLLPSHPIIKAVTHCLLHESIICLVLLFDCFSFDFWLFYCGADILQHQNASDAPPTTTTTSGRTKPSRIGTGFS